MSLSQALASAITGLKVNQSGLSLVAANVANADTPGYVRKTVTQVAHAGNNTGIGVRVGAIQRELDQYVQRQLRVENSGAAYADLRAQFYERLQGVYGVPGSASALETVYNNFTNAVQALATSPDDGAARASVISAGQLLVQRLNSMSGSIQGLRADAELGLADAVAKTNEALSQIAKLNRQIAASAQTDAAAATMLDQRDAYVDQLAQLMDINVVASDHNQISIFTNSGIQLVGTQAAQIAFDAQGTVTAAAQWSADPAERTIGTLLLTTPTGNAVDLVQSGAIRSGRIAAFLQMRDQDLVQAQSQIDAIAGAMASALSDRTTAGTAITSGLQNGFDIDIGALSAGNAITVSYTDPLTSTTRTLTLVRVDDPSALPLSTTGAGNNRTVGIDFSGGFSTVFGEINSALASTGMVASNPGGTTLRILDDGAGNVVNVNTVTVTTTSTTLNGGTAALPFFTDGPALYTGAVSATGSQIIGLAGRISINSALVADPSRLVLFDSGTAAGDSTRPAFLYEQLTAAARPFALDTGIGTETAPFSGSISTFLRQVISQQGDAASAADSLRQGQQVVLNALQQRFNETASVNIDQEMANLLNLQNAYAANARVLSVVREMLDALMQI